MEPVEVLRAALEAVEGAGIPADLRPLAFTTAVDLVVTGRVTPVPPAPAAARSRASLTLAEGPVAAASPRDQGVSAPLYGGTVIPAPAAAPARAAPAPGAGAPGAGLAGAGFDLTPVADTIGVPVERLDRLYDAHNGTLELCGDPSRFGRTRAERVGNVVLLLLAAMRWSGRDGGNAVPDVVVRAEVARLNLLDVGNYSKHLAARRALWATTGSGRGASYRVRYDGLEEARRLARALLDEPPA